MTKFEERLCEEVRKYRHLYDTSVREYRDPQRKSNSWREISRTLCSDQRTVKKRWKYIRDRFVKAKKRLKGPEGLKNIPAILESLSWLDTFVGLKEAETKYPFEKTGKENETPAFDEPTNVPCPKADHRLSALLPCSTPPRNPILVPSTPELETSELDSDSSYTLEDSETVNPAKRQRRDDSEEILKRLSARGTAEEQVGEEKSTVEYHFCMTMAKMLSSLPVKAKNVTMFKIHQLVYEAQNRHLFGVPEDI
ncbi:hypothetical protein Q5P01_022871 [Channa striata]|uniref:MADF domain-containing protein n=1 Tax=Channa striata TaxID=64152 RepID=A0AA88LRT5_CHASR|nr:hypothetical protein Q5P01_022871 [Channa striata]